jgi:hypothetical protein
MGLVSFVLLLTLIKGLVIFILSTHGKQGYGITAYVVAASPMPILFPCSQSSDIASPDLTSWMFTDTFTISSHGNPPVGQFQTLGPTHMVQILSYILR